MRKLTNMTSKIFGILVIFENELTYTRTLNDKIYKKTYLGNKMILYITFTEKFLKPVTSVS